MKSQRWIFCLTVIMVCLFLCGQNSIYAQAAQTGEISGTISDMSSKEPLPYANVVIKGTVVGDITDIYGNFRLSNLAPGDYTLKVSYIGYTSQEVQVTLNAGEKKKVIIDLDQPMVSVGEVVVSSQRMGQNAAINQQLSSDALVNVVSKDAIRSLPDVNAAEAIGRLPGISIVRSGGEGAKVVLRGLDPKFSNISINGITQPSTDYGTTGDRSVDLSNISPELLSGIEVFKSPTADMDADAIAGSINLVIAKAPDIPKNQIRLYGGYHDLHNALSNYKGSWDYSSRFLNKKLGVMAQANYERTDRGSHSQGTGFFDPDSEVADSFFVNSVSLTERKQITKRFGGLLMLDYQFDFGGIYLTNMYNSSPRDAFSQSKTINRTGEMTNSGLVTETTTNSLNSSLGGDLNLRKIKVNWNLTRVYTKIDNPYNMIANFTLAAPYGLDGEAVGASEIDPNYFLEHLAFNSVNRIKDTLSYLNTSQYSHGTMEQTNYTAKVDFERPIKLGDQIAGFFKFGAKYQTEDRYRHAYNFADQQYYLKPSLTDLAIAADPRGEDLAITASRRIQMSNFNEQTNIELLKGAYNFFPIITENQVRDWYTYHHKAGAVGGNSEYTVDNRYEENNYDCFESIASGYLMVKLNYGDLITLVPGIRYEYSNNTYHGIYSTINGDVGQNGYAEPDTSGQKYGEWLPSVHLKIKPIKWLDVRMSVARTLSRPNYMWVVPRFRYDALSNVVAMANPNLKHATAWNYDASVTAYTSKIGLISLGGYIKNIDNMFYQVSGTLSAERALLVGLPAQAFNLSEDYVNLDESWVRGLEFEYNTHFNFLPSPFNRFVLGFNLTRLWSGTYYMVWKRIEGIVMYKDVRPTLVVDFNKSYYQKTESRMPSQVDWTANTWLGYDFKGFSGRISMAYQGNRLTGINPNTDKKGYYTYTDNYLRFDVTAKQKITRKISVLLNLNNITNATERDIVMYLISLLTKTCMDLRLTWELSLTCNNL